MNDAEPVYLRLDIIHINLSAASEHPFFFLKVMFQEI
jgi:hypothetical protein